MIAADIRDRVRTFLGPRLNEGYVVSQLTTYRVGGVAAFHFLAESISDLELVAQVRQETGLPVLVLGRGSNVLVADEGFDGLVINSGRLHLRSPSGPTESPNASRPGRLSHCPFWHGEQRQQG